MMPVDPLILDWEPGWKSLRTLINANLCPSCLIRVFSVRLRVP
jgi:hypothetical protein